MKGFKYFYKTNVLTEFPLVIFCPISPLVFVAPFGRVRAAQFLLIFVVVVSPISRRDMAEREPVGLTIKVFFRDSPPPTMMATICDRIAVCRSVLRCGCPSGRQRCAASRKSFWTQQMLQLVIGLFAPYHSHLSQCRYLSIHFILWNFCSAKKFIGRNTTI